MDAHRQAGEAAQNIVRRPNRLAKLETFHARGERLQEGRHFEAREMHARADVRAEAKAQMRLGLSFDIEAFRVFPAALVAIGGGIEDEKACTSRNRRAVDLAIPCCNACESADR